MAFERNYVGSRLPAGYPSLPDGWHTEPFVNLSSDGKLKLFSAMHRKSKGPIRRLLAVAHGFGEHGGRYLHFPHFLESKFDAVFVPDHRGHGRSEGQRGDAERFDLLLEDFLKLQEEVVQKLEKENPADSGPIEVQVLGHSLGGHIALRMAHLHPELQVAAYHVSAPFLALKAPVNPVKRGAAHLISRVWGTLSLRAEFDANWLSHDPNVIQNYCADRLNHDRMTPRFYVAMAKAIQDTLRNFKECGRPIELLLPSQDPLIDSVVSHRFFEQLSGPHKRLVELEGFRHEPMNELGKEKFFQAILEFPKR